VPWFDGLVKGRSPYHRFLRHMSEWRLRNHKYAWPIEFKLYDVGKKLTRSLGIVRGPRLEARAAGVALEGTTHNVRDEAGALSG